MVYILVSLKQNDFPTVPASISVLDLSYLYLHAAVPRAEKTKNNTKLKVRRKIVNLSLKRPQPQNLCVVKYSDSCSNPN